MRDAAFKLARDDRGRIYLPEPYHECFDGGHRFIVLKGGRYGIKSTLAAMHTVRKSLERKNFRAYNAREVQASLGRSVKDLTIDIMRDLGNFSFDVVKDEIRIENGSIITFVGLSSQYKTDELAKGLHNVNLFTFEESQRLSRQSLEMLTPSIRAPNHQIVFTINPERETDAVYEDFIARPRSDTVVKELNYDSNKWRLPEMEDERLYDKEFKPFIYAHKWLGQLKREVEGAMWTNQDVIDMRADSPPSGPPDSIVIAIDPAGTKKKRSDKTGIVVVARHDDTGYILHSERIWALPDEWHARVNLLSKQYSCRRVILETSGAHATDAVDNLKKSYPDLNVTQQPPGTTSKYERAGGLQTLSKRGKLFLVGDHSDLESEMTSFTWDSKHDDIIDALVWGAKFVGLTGKKKPLFRSRLDNTDESMLEWRAVEFA